MSIEKIEGLVAQFVAERYYKNYRKDLDVRPHFVPLDLETLKQTLGHIIVHEEDLLDTEGKQRLEGLKGAARKTLLANLVLPIPKLIKKIEKHLENYRRLNVVGNDLIDAVTGEKMDIENFAQARVGESTKFVYLPATIYQNGKIIGALFPSFGSASKTLFTDFLNKEVSNFINKDIYKDTTTKIGFDLGHILTEGNPLYNTPLALKFKAIIDAVETVSNNLSSFGLQNTTDLDKFKNNLQTIFNTIRNHSTYGPQVALNIDKDFQANILSNLKIAANIVIIQDRHENQRIYADLYETPVGAKILELIKNLHFSRNLTEEIKYRLLHVAKSGKQSVTPTKSNKRTKPKQTALPQKGIKNTAGNGNNRVIVKTSNSTSAVMPSIANLESLLNSSLQERVRRNMGTGTRKDILNYRTGRFVDSVKLERLSQSRTGMITAFYSYMKNPYSTFSTGGQQEYPKTRDPKLLIARSIREIGAELAYNRMRAVLV